jgi:enoyl-CoA hydratase/carnithine racemase
MALVLAETRGPVGVARLNRPEARRLGKQAVLAADETPLTAGLDRERRLYELAMATEDRVEGMNAFIEKRRPEFRGR